MTSSVTIMGLPVMAWSGPLPKEGQHEVISMSGFLRILGVTYRAPVIAIDHRGEIVGVRMRGKFVAPWRTR